ncbi:MAG: DNA gyrase inhibitor YacG [Planctomycetota bacterium]
MNQTSRLQCPTCRKQFVPDLTSAAMPFCSVRCKMADLNRWFEEDVGLPVHTSDEEQEEESPPPPVREWKFD